MKRRLKENIEIGDRVFATRDEYQGTVIDINGDEVLVDGPFGEEYHNLNDLEKLGGDYEEDETPNFFKKRFTESKRKKIIRLTESDLTRIVRRVINEDKEKKIPNLQVVKLKVTNPLGSNFYDNYVEVKTDTNTILFNKCKANTDIASRNDCFSLNTTTLQNGTYPPSSFSGEIRVHYKNREFVCKLNKPCILKN